MNPQSSGLTEWGWSDWFEQRTECGPEQTIARVAAVDRDLLLLVDQAGPFRASLSGHYLHHHPLPSQKPCVGDWVLLQKAQDGFGIVHVLLERRTLLRRKMAGKAIESQLIAANVDSVLVVQSCHFDFNVSRLSRYLVMVRDGGAEPSILLTKTDLVSPEALASQVEQIRSAGIAEPVLTLSNLTGNGLEALQRQMQPGRTYCCVGSSGVGKSTLINRLTGQKTLDTKPVSATGEGRHTTVRRELIRLSGGAMVIDSPGMREFGVLGAQDGIEQSFSDITTLSANCRFRDCTHSGEPGCAVQEALQSGSLSQEQYESFLKLSEETRFYDMSYSERRKKDHDFGRFLKTVKKQIKDD
jgi:ribosome biogenesis GTPase / thiamine phosphate phosphatase